VADHYYFDHAEFSLYKDKLPNSIIVVSFGESK
jgi:hypothetical protein